MLGFCRPKIILFGNNNSDKNDNKTNKNEDNMTVSVTIIIIINMLSRSMHIKKQANNTLAYIFVFFEIVAGNLNIMCN